MTVTVSVDVTNSKARRDGDEVVQLYLSHPGVAGAPVRALEGFQRVHLARGEADGDVHLERPGAERRRRQGCTARSCRDSVDVWVGGGQPVSRPGLAQAAGVKTSFKVTKSAVLPK